MVGFSRKGKGVTVGADDYNRIMVEVTTGKPPAVPDTPEMAQFRQAFTARAADAQSRGLVLQIPND